MCIPHGMQAMKQAPSSKRKAKVEKKQITMVSKDLFENGDPDFVDERTTPYEPKKKKSWLDGLLG